MSATERATKRAIKRSVRRPRRRQEHDASPDAILASAGITPARARLSRPVVGITTTTEAVTAPFGVGIDGDAAPVQFGRIIQENGGVPVLLPPVVSAADVQHHLALVDGLVLSGGFDMHPNFLGAEAEPGATYDPRKDRYEWRLLDRALDKDVPLLAVGRGLRLLNAFLGGTPPEAGEVDRLEPQSPQEARKRLEMRQSIRVVSKTLLSRIVRVGSMKVDTLESAQLGQLSESMKADAYGADRSVQAAEVTERRFALAVRFHPELMTVEEKVGSQIIGALVAAARGESL